MIKNKLNKNAFSIIEIMIGIFIFTLGLISIYGIIVSTLKLNDYNKDYIIATNLAREQIELARNIRDSNYKKIKPYNLKNPDGNSYNISDKFEVGKYYKIENRFDGTNFPVKVEFINNILNKESYRLCLDNNRYIYCSGITGEIKTNFYKYIEVKSIIGENNVLKINSKVIWQSRGEHDFEIQSILADWKRL